MPAKGSSILTISQQAEVIRRYSFGESGVCLSQCFDVCHGVIYKILRNSNIAIRNNRKRRINEYVFSEINEDSLYWYGFLMADGSVSGANNFISLIVVTLSEKDSKHLYKFRDFLESDYPIIHTVKDDGNAVARIAISSIRMANQLISHGIRPRKTYGTTASKLLASNRHFWRGFVDGNGHFSIDKKGFPRFSLCGSDPLMRQFIEYVKNLTGYTLSLQKKKVISLVQLSGRKLVELTANLYSPCHVALDRKLILAKRILAWEPPNLKKPWNRSCQPSVERRLASN